MRHEVRPDLLAAVSRGTGERDAALEETRRHLRRLAQDADAVILTCSSLGPACEDWPEAPDTLIRADEALAASCTARGGRVLALYAAPSSQAPTERLFQRAGEQTSAEVTCQRVDGAWAHFLDGRHDDYEAAVAQAVVFAGPRFDVIALAQTSMAAAARRLGPQTPVRTVPDAVMTRLGGLLAATSALTD